MDLTDTDKRNPDQAEALQGAKKFLTVLSGTLKKLNLYSENHRIYQDALNSLKATLKDFSDRFGHLKIAIHRDRICYDDQVIYQVGSEQIDIAFILFRDGIKWIDFSPGLELWEMNTLLKVLQKYSRLEEDNEDDIVTALWQYNLPCIQYEAADPALDGEENLDISKLKCRPEIEAGEFFESETNKSTGESTSGTRSQSYSGPEVPVLAQKKDLWLLTPREREQLRKMIAEEEKLDGTDHVIDVLLYILEKEEQSEADIENLLEILIRELREVLVQGRYAYLLNILTYLKEGLQHINTKGESPGDYRDRFFSGLSSEGFLGALKEIEDHIEYASADEIKILKQALLSLPESSIHVLVPMIADTSSGKTLKLLLELVGILARRDMFVFEQVTRSSTPEILVQLVVVLRALKEEKAAKILRSLVKHESAMVREEALKAILVDEEILLTELFDLLEDPDENIRQLLFYSLGQKRDEKVEGMLLEYFKNRDPKMMDKEFYFAILRVLGRCGSDRSIHFLIKQLYLWPSLGVLRPIKNKHQQAVLNALRELDSEKANNLIQRVSKGMFYNIFKSN